MPLSGCGLSPQNTMQEGPAETRAGLQPANLGAGGIFHSLLDPSTRYDFELRLQPRSDERLVRERSRTAHRPHHEA